MKPTKRHLLVLTALSLLIFAAGCSERNPTDLEVARARVDPLVFDDAYGDDVYFQPFFETNYVAASFDSVFAYEGFAPDGARSLKMTVPALGSALGPYSGGVLTSGASRDLTDFNALTFYARADADISLNEIGFGNDNTGTSLYSAGRSGIPLTSEWTFVVVPIPVPSKLIAERGLFTFAEGAEAAFPGGYNIWFDEIRFAKLGNIELFRASMPSVSRQFFIGSSVTLAGTSTIFTLDGAFVPVSHMPGYFDYASSNPAAADVIQGRIVVTGEGQATITARPLVSASGDTVTVNGRAIVTGYRPPTVAAARPTRPAANVISMFSDAYPNVPVGTWNTRWSGSTTQNEEYVVAGDNTLMYSALNYVGIEFLNPKIDASQMTHFHLDVYAPAGTNFKLKFVSFPPDLTAGVQTTDLVLDATTTPAFNAGAWSSLDVPLADFTLPANWDWAYLGQLVPSTSNAQLVLVDNVYFYK